MSANKASTECRNPLSTGIDKKSTREIVEIINNEDKKVPYAVEAALDQISYVTDKVVSSFQRGGRLFYVGAGTSGRLGVLDASECPPTYGVDSNMVQGIIAGGERALTHSIEGAEDDPNTSVEELKRRGLSSVDTVIGITANGGAPFVVGALKYALSLGCFVSAISSNQKTPVFDLIEDEARIYLPVGPEIITGSTRMKSGTAQKLTLNIITTTAMIMLGKVYNNLMVDLKPVNNKLINRSINMISEITSLSIERSKELFTLSEGNTKLAIVMGALDITKREAEELVNKYPSLGTLFDNTDVRNLSSEFKK